MLEEFLIGVAVAVIVFAVKAVISTAAVTGAAVVLVKVLRKTFPNHLN